MCYWRLRKRTVGCWKLGGDGSKLCLTVLLGRCSSDSCLCLMEVVLSDCLCLLEAVLSSCLCLLEVVLSGCLLQSMLERGVSHASLERTRWSRAGAFLWMGFCVDSTRPAGVSESCLDSGRALLLLLVTWGHFCGLFWAI